MGPMGVIVTGMLPFSGRIRWWGDVVRNMLPGELLEFLVPKLLSVFGMSPVSDLTPPLATNGTCTPGHRWILEIGTH